MMVSCPSPVQVTSHVTLHQLNVNLFLLIQIYHTYLGEPTSVVRRRAVSQQMRMHVYYDPDTVPQLSTALRDVIQARQYFESVSLLLPVIHYRQICRFRGWLVHVQMHVKISGHNTLKRHDHFVAFYFYCKIMLISISYNYCSVLTANKCFIETELTL